MISYDPQNPTYRILRVNNVHDLAHEEVARVALETINTGGNANDRALKVQGKAEIVRNADDETALMVTNTSGDAEARALKVEGLSEFGNGAPSIRVLNNDGTGRIYLGKVEGQPLTFPRLMIEANVPVPEMNNGARIEAHIDTLGLHHAEGTLYLNADPGTFDVVISHEDTFEAQHNPATVRVLSPRMTLGSTLGELQPGQLDGNGIEGLEPVPLDLRIGTRGITGDVHIGREGQTVNVLTQARLNSNGFVLNNASAVDDVPTAGCGFIFNDAGHGGGGAAIDFYTGGTLRGWVDSLGFHNAPLP